ncbi:MAG: hypothetical protein ACJ79S_19825, partial [Gemmatimonadaceae bacterium]
RYDDDVSVWTWARGGITQAGWWEIKLPLLGTGGMRIGSLVLWQDGLAHETSLSHMHTVARDLRAVVQGKLEAFWHGSDIARTYDHVVPLPPEPAVRRAREAALVAPRVAEGGRAVAATPLTTPTQRPSRVGLT